MFGFFMNRKRKEYDRQLELANWCLDKSKDMASRGNDAEAQYLLDMAMEVLKNLPK